jgi:hypothetical protein
MVVDTSLEKKEEEKEDLEGIDFESIIALYDEFIAFFTRPNLHIQCGALLYIQITTEQRCWKRLYKRFLEHTAARTRAVMESTHARLGDASWLHALDPDLTRQHLVLAARKPYEPLPWEGNNNNNDNDDGDASFSL